MYESGNKMLPGCVAFLRYKHLKLKERITYCAIQMTVACSQIYGHVASLIRKSSTAGECWSDLRGEGGGGLEMS